MSLADEYQNATECRNVEFHIFCKLEYEHIRSKRFGTLPSGQAPSGLFHCLDTMTDPLIRFTPVWTVVLVSVIAAVMAGDAAGTRP
jgi:hypothetical protein